MKSLILSLAILLSLTFFASSALAGVALDVPFQHKQPNGDSVTLRNRGDEFIHWIEEVFTGYMVRLNPHSQAYEYVADDTKEGSFSGVPAGHALYKPDSIKAKRRPAENKERRKKAEAAIKENHRRYLETTKYYSSSAQSIAYTTSGNDPGGTYSTSLPATTYPSYDSDYPAPVSRTVPVLVVLLYNDSIPFPFDSQVVAFNFFENDGYASTVAKYFTDQSNGLFTIIPAPHRQTGYPAGVLKIRSNYDLSQLGTYDPDTDSDLFVQVANDAYLTIRALDYINPYDFHNTANPSNPYGVTPDELSIVFVFPGYDRSGQRVTPLKMPSLWPEFHYDHLTADGEQTYVAGFTGIAAKHGDDDLQDGIGSAVHELSHHILGLPDLYDTAEVNPTAGLGNFSVMAGGNWGYFLYGVGERPKDRPVGYDAWSRVFSGWVRPVIPSAGDFSFQSLREAPNNVVKITDHLHSSEYWYAEYIYPSGWDLGFTGFGLNDGFTTSPWSTFSGGIFVTHVDDSVTTNDSSVYASHPMVKVVQPDSSVFLGDCLMDHDYHRGCVDDIFHSPGYYPFNLNFYAPGLDPLPFYNGVSSMQTLSSTPIRVFDTQFDIFDNVYDSFAPIFESSMYRYQKKIYSLNTTYVGDIDINYDMLYNIYGGFNDSFTEVIGSTIVNGSINISNGTLTVKNVVIQ